MQAGARFERWLAQWAVAAVIVIAMQLPALALGPVSVAGLAKGLQDAVVNISSTRVVGPQGEAFPDAPPGSPLGDLFDQLNPNNGQGDEAMGEARSLGSGFIIDAKGLIVTNNHVIEGADEILVYTTDGKRYSAKLVGADEKTDLAVLRIDAGHDLPFVSFGDSDTAEVGDWVMAIGNPFGLGGSVTLGIVSARNRDIQTGPYDNFIQTDAAINQGNSGGPLFDMDGRVVGINSAIISRTGGSLGIGFAVPANLARPVIEQLARYGETRRGWLGVSIQDVTEDIAQSLGLAGTQGAMVVGVTKGGPSQGVLRDGDIILDFDGRAIQQMRDLPRFVAETEVGKKVVVQVMRGDKQTQLTIALGRLEDGERLMAAQDEERLAEADTEPAPDPAAPNDPDPTDTAARQESLRAMVGLDADWLTSKTRRDYGFSSGMKGVVVTEVTHGSDAETKGIIPGLLIREVNQQPVGSLEELVQLVGAAREAGRPAVLLKVADAAGQARYVAVRLN